MNQPASKLNDLRDLCVDFTIPLTAMQLRGYLHEAEKCLGEYVGSVSKVEPLEMLFVTKGIVLFRMGRFADAVDAFKNAANHDGGKSRDILPNLVSALVEADRGQEALRVSERTLASAHFSTQHGLFWLNHAEALFANGRTAEAHEACAKGLSLLDFKNPLFVFNAAKTAALLCADHEAATLFARYLALKLGKKLGKTDPVAFITDAPENVRAPLYFPENFALFRSIRRVTPLVVGDDEDDSGAVALLEQWSDLRQAANEHVLSGAAE